MRLVGHCNCGGVKYECDEQPQITAVCHWKTCQRQTGTNLSLVVGVKDAALHVEGEALGTLSPEVNSGQDVHGALYPLWVANRQPVRFRSWNSPYQAGTLDDTSELKPSAEFHLEDAQPWSPRHKGA